MCSLSSINLQKNKVCYNSSVARRIWFELSSIYYWSSLNYLTDCENDLFTAYNRIVLLHSKNQFDVVFKTEAIFCENLNFIGKSLFANKFL